MKKILSGILLGAMLFSSINISALPLHKYEEVIPISKSITLTKVREFYAGHNISYSHIKADLNDKNISLNLLKSQNGADILETVPTLASTEADTVAAMNADFFSVHSGSKGFSLGIEVQDGNMLQSPIYPETMATVTADDNTLSMGYIEFLFAAVAPNGNFNVIRHLNKHTTYFGDILMYTSNWNGGYSPAPGGDVVEVVVEDGKVKEFRRNMPAVQIPENGCVLVVSEGVNMFLANNFAVGDEIKFDYYITPDVSKADAAFGGGAMLVNQGEVVKEFSHVISGYNPRSAVGMSKDGKTLHMVAVDGRQTSSRGMSMSELAGLMKELGCYNAVNLDGGGSTNMTASTVWNKNLTTANSPTENRKVINALGLSYKAPAGKPAGIVLRPSKDVVILGESINIEAAVYDENMRPLSEAVSFSSADGNISGTTFTPTKGANAVIEAKSGNAAASASVYVIDKISGIDVPSHIHLKKGETTNLTVNVFDALGKFATVSDVTPFKIRSWDTSVVTANGSSLTGLKDGTATVSVEKDGAISYISVSVGSKAYDYTETFEYSEGSFTAYPKEVPGGFELSSKYAASGSMSGYLSYDFTAEDSATKGVYYDLKTTKTLSDNAGFVEVYVYSENDIDHDIRAQFMDSTGQVHRSLFAEGLTGGRWHKLQCPVPEDAPKPVRLDKIYTVYVDGEAKDSGGIYLDNLSYRLSENTAFEASPSNTYTDTKEAVYPEGTFRIGALVNKPSTLLSGLVNSKMSQHVSANASNALIGALKPFSTREDASGIYISVNTSEGGIRATDSSQWNSIANAIYATSKENVFILSEDSIFGSNQFENQVIIDYFAKLQKNIFVITGGDKNTYKNINGVKYFTLCNTEKEQLSRQKLDGYEYLEFSFGKEVTHKWVKLY